MVASQWAVNGQLWITLFLRKQFKFYGETWCLSHECHNSESLERWIEWRKSYNTYKVTKPLLSTLYYIYFLFKVFLQSLEVSHSQQCYLSDSWVYLFISSWYSSSGSWLDKEYTDFQITFGFFLIKDIFCFQWLITLGSEMGWQIFPTNSHTHTSAASYCLQYLRGKYSACGAGISAWCVMYSATQGVWPIDCSSGCITICP